MGRSHAKNTTTQANLSYYERLKLKQSTAARRLGQESFKPLDACNLCLSRATYPVACGAAHIFCRECALSDLLQQKAGLEAHKSQLRAWEDDDARRRADARDAARARVVADFERGMGLAGGRGSRVASTASTPAGGARFKLDEDAIEAAAAEAEERASAAIEAEASEARKAKIAAFWLPANAPSAPLGPLKAVKLQTLCHVGGVGKAHPISLKGLLPVVLKYPPGKEKGGLPTCPSCQRDLSNASGAVLLTSREPAGVEGDGGKDKGEAEARDGNGDGPRKKAKREKKDKLPPAVCGHVVCKTCADTVVKPVGRCCVCEAKVGAGDMLPLGSEGTGYAASGGAEVKTSSVVVFRV